MTAYYSNTTDDMIYLTSGVLLQNVAVSAPLSSTSFQRISTTFTVPVTARTIRIGLISSTLNNTEFISWTGVKLEVGTVATPFSRAGGTISTELAACQRYYEKSYALSTSPGTATQTGMINIQVPSASTGNIRAAAPFNVTKRVTPTIALYDGAGTINKVMYDYSNNKIGTAVGTEKWADVYSDGTTNKFALSFHYTADAEL
jgi:hypothetical protein